MTTDVKLECLRCGYTWSPRDPVNVPGVCSRCRNPYWDRPYSGPRKVK